MATIRLIITKLNEDKKAKIITRLKNKIKYPMYFVYLNKDLKCTITLTADADYGAVLNEVSNIINSVKNPQAKKQKLTTNDLDMVVEHTKAENKKKKEREKKKSSE